MPSVLDALVRALVEEGFYPNVAAAAVGLGLGHPRLSRLIKGTDIAGSKTIGQLCSKLNPMAAAELLQAYLLDERDTVIRTAKETGSPKWDHLVSVELAKKIAAYVHGEGGSNSMTEKLIKFFRLKHDLMVGERSAEKAIKDAGSMPTVTIKGRDASVGIPRVIVVDSPEVLAVIDG